MAQSKAHNQDQIEFIEKQQKQAILESYEKDQERIEIKINDIYTPIYQAAMITPFSVNLI